MFITQLMKHPNFAISVADHIQINIENGKHQLLFLDNEQAFDIGADLAKLLLQIQRQKLMTLTALRTHIHQLTDPSNTTLFIHQYIHWNNINLHIVDDNEQLLLTLENVFYKNKPIDLASLGDDKLVLSRFVSLNREDDKVVLSKPLEDNRFVINSAKLDTLLFALFAGVRVAELLAEYQDAMHAPIQLFLQLLLAKNFLMRFTDNIPNRIEEGSQIDTQWDVADIKFHASSRFGYHFGEFGGGFPFVNLIKPRPAVRELPAGKRIDLYVPDIDKLASSDGSLTQLQIQRLSIRGYNEDKPISAKQLGEFFYRTARVLYQAESEVSNINDPTQKTNMGFAWRPYPTGGASYELEIYLTIDRCADLAPGIYYYAPKTHQLIQLSEKNTHTETLIDFAHTSCARIVRPQALVHIAARFQRVSWKYHAIAYATMLRNTGVLYQTFYLNAVAMGIAPCGLGSGNIKAFAAATGNDPLVEGNIGEFMLGSLPKNFKFSQLDQNQVARIHGAVLAGAGK